MHDDILTPYPSLDPPDPQQDIPTRFRYVARTLPDHAAVVDESGATCYATLDTKSDSVAAHLIARFGDIPEPVALLLPRNAFAVIAILGVLKAGKFYVPLDPTTEPGAQRIVLQTSAAQILLTSSDLLPIAESFASAETQIIALDTLDLGQEIAAPSPAITFRTFASVSFTSGSTGEPKGIIWHHGGWLNRVRLHRLYDQIRPGDRVNQTFSPAFVLYSTVTFSALLNGATLYYHPASTQGLAELFSWLNQRAITVFFAPVSLLRDLLAASQDLVRLSSVRAVLVGGQTILARELVRLPELVPPDCVITNRLSMSELLWVTRYVIRESDIQPTLDPVPVGYACDGNEIKIVDEQGNPVEPGQVGQIVVQSRYLSPGYWRNPELTASKFLPDPTGGDVRILLTGDRGVMRPDGCLEYHGRMDFMVKLRGYRVEPEAIETALLTYPQIRECVVVAHPSHNGDSRLIAYLAPREMPGPTTSELRERLAQSLPTYMIPARFFVLENLPRNANGKVDRRALPPPGRTRPELDTPFVPPRTEIETQIANIWCELLDLDEVGVHDNFFALGGDSLLAINLVLEIEKWFARQVPPDYFRKPTIAALATLMSDEAESPEFTTQTETHPASPNPWAHRIARLRARQVSLGTIARWAIREVSLRLTFRQGVRWLTWWFSHRTISHVLYKSERAKFIRLCESLGNPGAASESAFQIRMLSNAIWMNAGQWQDVLLKPGGFLCVMRESRHRFWQSFVNLVDQSVGIARDRIIVFDGIEHLANARAKGRGVILVSYHSPTGSIATALLAQYTDTGPILTISPAVAHWIVESEEPARLQTSNLNQIAMATAVAVRGQRILKEGGIVQVYNDIASPEAGTFSFFIGGRVYDFKSGFAELALSTGASVIPVYSTHQADGRIRIRILPPLEPLANANHPAQVRDLVEQYARFVENTWRNVPESISWYVTQLHFERPVVAEQTRTIS